MGGLLQIFEIFVGNSSAALRIGQIADAQVFDSCEVAVDGLPRSQ